MPRVKRCHIIFALMIVFSFSSLAFFHTDPVPTEREYAEALRARARATREYSSAASSYASAESSVRSAVTQQGAIFNALTGYANYAQQDAYQASENADTARKYEMISEYDYPADLAKSFRQLHEIIDWLIAGSDALRKRSYTAKKLANKLRGRVNIPREFSDAVRERYNALREYFDAQREYNAASINTHDIDLIIDASNKVIAISRKHDIDANYKGADAFQEYSDMARKQAYGLREVARVYREQTYRLQR